MCQNQPTHVLSAVGLLARASGEQILAGLETFFTEPLLQSIRQMSDFDKLENQIQITP
jgi:hypothetical protein